VTFLNKKIVKGSDVRFRLDFGGIHFCALIFAGGSDGRYARTTLRFSGKQRAGVCSFSQCGVGDGTWEASSSRVWRRLPAFMAGGVTNGHLSLPWVACFDRHPTISQISGVFLFFSTVPLIISGRLAVFKQPLHLAPSSPSTPTHITISP
jgi:hypothetical protein